jgi:hypothetical protein
MKLAITLTMCLLISAGAFSQGLQKLRKYPVIFMLPKQTFRLSGVTGNKIEQPVPQNFYAQHLGFFCRQEIKMKQAHVPVTFRLGSMDYCNRLEQKPGYR